MADSRRTGVTPSEPASAPGTGSPSHHPSRRRSLPDLSVHPSTDRYAVWWQEQAVVALDARTLYQSEKAKRATRLAKQESACQESARLYHARAEADREARARGGRPKGPRLHLVSDPGNALVTALRPYRGDE